MRLTFLCSLFHSQVPNLFAQPPSLVRDGVESLCPKDPKFLPTMYVLLLLVFLSLFSPPFFLAALPSSFFHLFVLLRHILKVPFRSLCCRWCAWTPFYFPSRRRVMADCAFYFCCSFPLDLRSTRHYCNRKAPVHLVLEWPTDFLRLSTMVSLRFIITAFLSSPKMLRRVTG